MSDRQVLSSAPQDFLVAMGQLVFDFASLELLASEIITAKYRNAMSHSSGWAQSGRQFVSDLRKCFPDDADFSALCDQMEDFYIRRNFYVHSDWMFYDDGTASLMNRRHRKNASHSVALDVNPRVTAKDINRLTSAIGPLKAELEAFVIRAMGPWNEC